MLPAHNKIKKHISKSQFGQHLGEYSDIQQNIPKMLKQKHYTLIAKYKYFLTLQFAQYFDIIRTNFPQMCNQIQKNFPNFN